LLAVLLAPVAFPGKAFQLEGFRSGLNSSRYVVFEMAVQVSSMFESASAGDKRIGGGGATLPAPTPP